MNELNKRCPDNPTAFLIRHKLIKITPSKRGIDCLAYNPGEKCACDECEHVGFCFEGLTWDDKENCWK